MQEIKIGILYPLDPAGNVIGGIDSFVRGLVKYAPEDIKYVIYGATMDTVARPVRSWTKCQLGDRFCEFFPVIQMNGSGRQSRIPVTVSYELSAMAHRPDFGRCDILEAHRIEHLLIRGGNKPVNLFLHQDMAVLKQGGADIRWRYLPDLYRWLEKRVLCKASSVYCVREEAVNSYRKANPSISNKFKFQSTWMDPEIFYPVEVSEREELRYRLSKDLNIPGDRRWLVAVGRLDHQKDPLLMVRAVAKVIKSRPDIHLIWVGEGVLKDDVLKEINALGLTSNVTLAGLLKPEQVANMNRAANMFVMSSAYEGMPIALIEAMACGLPAVTTDVGEVRRLVSVGHTGEICPTADAEALASALIRGLDSSERYRGMPCIETASRYTPQNVLGPVYANYRKLVGRAEASGR